MASKYPKEVHTFIAEYVKGTTTRDLTAMVNEHFGKELFTENSMKSYKFNHHLKSGTPTGNPKGGPSKVFPQHVVEYIHANYKGVGGTEMAKRLNERFGTNYKASQVKAYYANHHLNSGLTGHFSKGHVPFICGKKGYCAPGSEKGWFQKGQKAHNQQEIGTVRRRAGGYWRKVGPGSLDWKQEHILRWEEAHGPVPEDSILIFKDGDPFNIDLSNIACISRAEHMHINRKGLRFDDAEMTDTGIMIARVQTTAFKRMKELKGTK